MEQIRDSVLKCLERYKNEERLIKELNVLADNGGPEVYPIIFHVLTNLVIEPDEAEQCWQDILLHYSELKNVLGRKVSLRTAICDYFCSIHKSLKNPKVVEIHIYEKTVKASRYDSLTKLYNRQFFDETIEREINRARRHNLDLSILFFDLDDFKHINDTFGHLAGDKVLQNVAQIILSEKRSEDIAARYGGEEIVVILPETDKVNAMVLGERIRQRVASTEIKYKGHTIRLTISGGLAAYPFNASNTPDLMKCADQALYRAKGSGKNNISFFSEDKRRYLRIDLNKNVMIRELGFEDVETQPAKGKNICIGGILFESDFSIPIGTRVQVNIPTRKDVPLVIIGTVKRIEKYGARKYGIGVSFSFLEMDKAIKDEISRWLLSNRQEVLPEIEHLSQD
jgi:diguanylate cyclase (GGDEF)-like protein